jgi:hypothetical protein
MFVEWRQGSLLWLKKKVVEINACDEFLGINLFMCSNVDPSLERKLF